MDERLDRCSQLSKLVQIEADRDVTVELAFPFTAGEPSYQVQMQRKVGHHTKHVPDPILPHMHRDPLLTLVHICTLAKSDRFLPHFPK